ncbi:MAG: hypothetical protein U0169_03565 [Polyangiaceae bacterium]
MKKRIFTDLTLPERRSFLKWVTAASAVMGLDRVGVLDALSGSAGVAAADALNLHYRRFVGIVAGNGGFAWFQLIWPHLAVARGTDPAYAFHAMGQTKEAATTKPFMYAPESPFQDAGANWQMTAMMAGQNETHTATPLSAASLASGVGMFASVAAAQRQRLSTLIPVVANERMRLSYQSADNAPQVASVPSADGVVSLFSSRASKRLIAKREDAALYEATYKAFLTLKSSGLCVADAPSNRVGQVASNVIGANFESRLTMSNEDLARYGVIGARGPLVNLAKDLWMALRLFQYDLTGMYLTNAFNDDPHGAFAAGDANAQNNSKVLGQIFDAFRADAASIPDPSAPGLSIADNLVFTVSGDTPKNPLQRMGWPDGTPMNSNWLYVMGNGYLKTGWFGGVQADGSVNGWNPATGEEVPRQASTTTAHAASAAVYYAVTSGQGDIVSASRGDVSNIAGVTHVNPQGKST